MDSGFFRLRELFHLALLRHLGIRISGRSYAVKGGICLRFFHRSARLSEDMDLDIVSSVRMGTLRDAVDSVINGSSLLASLMPSGIVKLAATKPKQTETTQRWKVALILSNGESLPTKLEFSRRKDRIAFSTGVPDAELLRRYKMPPFAAQFYGPLSMAAQKTSALASASRNALRDLFDLHHLLFTIGVKPEDLGKSVDGAVVEAAAEKVAGFEFKDFREQVIPHLSTELMDLYRDSAVFEKQKEDIAEVFSRIMK